VITLNAHESISFVESISDSEVSVKCRDDTAAELVKSLGGKRALLASAIWKLHYSSEVELASHLSALRDARIAMAGSLVGWPPAAIFEQLRDNGKLTGKFIEIMWSKPDEEVLSEK
jgi:hypothetical protein